MDAKNTKLYFQELTNKIGRYPQGFRHYESYANYKFIEKDATIQDYMQEMNRQCEFDEFLRIVREAAIEEMETPKFQHKVKDNYERSDGIKPIDLIESQMFEAEARAIYEAKV